MQRGGDLKEAIDALDMEFFLEREGIDYKVTHGSSGAQLNVRECPVCGNRKWKVFLNEDTGLGNCLSGDTKIVTREYGAIAIEKVAGETVTLLDGNRNWVPCVVHDHGVQTTYAAKFGSYSGSHIVRSTAEHGWVTPEGDIVLTKELRRTKSGSSEIGDLRYGREVTDNDQYEKGVIHGLIYGDGSKEEAGNYRIRVCSHHESIYPHLDRFDFARIKSGAREDRRYYIPRREAWVELKELPDPVKCHIDYLVGFFRGWLATDGCVDTKGVVSICCGVEESRWISQWAPVIGWLPRKHSLLSNKTNFGERNKVVGNQFFAMASMIAEDFIVEQHRERWRLRSSGARPGSAKWTFRDTKEGKTKPYAPRLERVYCPEVPTTSSFALASGIHSRNCFAGSHPPGENFNKWSFIHASLGMSKRDTAQYIIEAAGELGWIPPKETIKQVNENVELKLPASVPLPFEGRYLRYLSNRGIPAEVAEYFHLRYCKKGWFRYLVNGEERFMSFANRVIIPVYDLQGNMVSYQGRDTTGEAEKKYLFPPGFASTGKYLYNGHNAVGAKEIAVGEGAFDVAAIKVAFMEDPALRHVVPVGTFGKHLSTRSDECSDQLNAFIQLKEAGLKSVTFMWDSEASALDAATRAGEELMKIGLAVRIAVLPQGKDPNEATPQEVREAYLKSTLLNRSNMAKLRLLAKTA